MNASLLVLVVASLLAAGPGELEIVVRGPDGKPVANRPAQLVEDQLSPFPSREAPKSRELRTDAQGRLRLSVKEGLRRLNVVVPGVGFGGTGVFEARNGRVTRPDLPRLARFARVEGQVDPSLFQAGMRVEASRHAIPERSTDNVSVLCDAEGRFVFEEIVPGAIYLRLFQDQRRVPLEQTAFLTEPGQVRNDVVLAPPRPPDPAEEHESEEILKYLNWDKDEEEITWAEGTVRDERGVPLDSAEVLVKGVYYGGIRNYSEVRTTRTDARGHYRVRGPHWRFQEAFTLVVLVPDRAPLLTYAASPDREDAGPRGPLDLTMPDRARGGALDIRVLKDGSPAPNVAVTLHEQRLVDRVWSAPGGDHKAQDALHKPFAPVEHTDKEGIARFKDLYPCSYRFQAGENERGGRAASGSVAVAAGQTVSLTVSLHDADNAVTLQAVRPDGTPPTHRNIRFSFGLRETYAMSTMRFNNIGVGTYHFDARGLWAVGLLFRETEGRGISSDDWEPCYLGETLLPVSPAFALETPVKLTCDLHRPGSIRAQLVGLDGKPARGTVLIMASSGPDRGRIDRAASTDENGVALFADLVSGSYRIRGSMEAIEPANLPGVDGRAPDDAGLRNQIVFPVEELKVEPGKEAHARPQPVRAAYVRGTIQPAPGAKASDYTVSAGQDWTRLSYHIERDAARGAYLGGPFLPGKVELRLHRALPAGSPRDTSRSITLAPGELGRLDLTATPGPDNPELPSRASSLGTIGIGGVLEAPPVETIAGTVVQSDGKSPAFGARAVLIVPGESQPIGQAISDAAGRLTWTGLWISLDTSSDVSQRPGQVAVPTVVVSQPGLAGASVVPLGPHGPQSFRAVLPPPLNAEGRVTLGGRPITDQDAQIRVIAEHQGGGVLDGPLSAEATVRPDGRFVLRGLTPGTYRAQAARDGIWLSRSTTFTIAPDHRPDDLKLDVPDPGAAVVLAFVNGDGRPAGRQHVQLARPEGPFRDLWPERFTTDADGSVLVRGLEAGEHQFRIEGEDAPRAFHVPRAGQAAKRLVFTVKAAPG